MSLITLLRLGSTLSVSFHSLCISFPASLLRSA